MSETSKKLKKKTDPNLTENAPIGKIKSDRNLFKAADKFLDVRAMFPKSKIDLRKGLSDYQRKKIRKEFFDFAKIAGDFEPEKKGPRFLSNDFAPAVRTKAMREYMRDVGLPKFSRGVLLQGGSKLNGKVRIKNGGLHYQAGTREQLQFPLDATTERTLVNSIRKHKKLINKDGLVSYIGTHGGKIHNLSVRADLDHEETTDILENAATEIYNKYLKMAELNQMRTNGRYAAHPSKWGMVLISEPL